MKNTFKRVISALISAIMLFSFIPFCENYISGFKGIFYSEANATAEKYSIGDIIKFGTYPQSVLSDSSIIMQLNLKVDNNNLLSDEVAVTYGSTKYLRSNSVWYICEDISWRILDIDNSKYFVQAVNVLDWQAYNNSGSSSSWCNSSINNWLNTTFYDRAFTNSEKAQIKDYSIENNLCKVFIISYDDAVNTKYGFNSSPTYDDSKRVAYSTKYAQSKGASSGACNWMLRGSGTISAVRYSLSSDGCVGNCHGTMSVSKKIGIRPAAVINYGKQTHTVPDYKAKNTSYADRYFNGCGLALDGAGSTPDMCIPELSESFGYIPQGIGF